MGMYDTLYISTNELPLTQVEKDELGESLQFQTKDLDCNLDHYSIINGYMKKYQFGNKQEGKKFEYTGKIVFYDGFKSTPLFPQGWIEFEGTFINGIMRDLRRI